MKPPRIQADTESTEVPDAPLIDRELTEAIIGAFFEVYNELGYGFLESVYRRALRIALTAREPRPRPKLRSTCPFAGSRWATFEPISSSQDG